MEEGKQVYIAKGSGWRTITADEGVYLFSARQNALKLFTYATIYTSDKTIYGLVFLPDNWDLTTPPTGCSYSSAESRGFSWNNGAYWSGTPDPRPGEACMLEFIDGSTGYFNPDHFPAYYGACVRLVKDFN